MTEKDATVLKVLFLITTHGHGRGGHFYDLKTTVEQMMTNTNVSVLNIGTRPSPIVESLGNFVFFMKFKGLLSTLWRMVVHIRHVRPDIIHAFDLESYFFARIASLVTKIPLVLTKCGGPNPTKYYPCALSLVLYSAENMNFFRGKKKYGNTKIYLIPNRVLTPKQDAERIAELRNLLKPNLPVFLRIARISKNYKHSILQSINLVKKLNADETKVQLLILGVVQNEEVFVELSHHESENIKLVTKDRFTINASELIDVAEFVVGTGRGFMEGALLEKLMLAPCSNLTIPIVTTENNIKKIASLNFSERPVVAETDDKAFRCVEKIMNNRGNRQRLAKFIKQYAIDNFSADHIYEKHNPVYQQAQSAELRLGDLLVHGYLTWKLFFSAR